MVWVTLDASVQVFIQDVTGLLGRKGEVCTLDILAEESLDMRATKL